MDNLLNAFFREAQDVTLASSDRSAVRDAIINKISSFYTGSEQKFVAVPVAVSSRS